MDRLDITQSTINRLNYLDRHGEGIDATINALCEYAENTPYEFFNLPECSKPYKRKLGSIPIGGTKTYLVPFNKHEEFDHAVYCYGTRYKMKFSIDYPTQERIQSVFTVTVTRLA